MRIREPFSFLTFLLNKEKVLKQLFIKKGVSSDIKISFSLGSYLKA